jgi:hypothetical protein
VSEYRVEKRRAQAVLTLSTGSRVRGCFFLASSRASQGGPERVVDLLNSESGFFPFELSAERGAPSALYNRSQVVLVTLLDNPTEAQLEPGYSLATERLVRMLLSNGAEIVGSVRVYRPTGRDRLSDYARLPDTFRYVETEDGTLIVNWGHIVELREISAA